LLIERRFIVSNWEYVFDWAEKGYKCCDCGTTRSVKYIKDGENYCNICILGTIGKKSDEDDTQEV
jgi:hypothetical protein